MGPVGKYIFLLKTFSLYVAKNPARQSVKDIATIWPLAWLSSVTEFRGKGWLKNMSGQQPYLEPWDTQNFKEKRKTYLFLKINRFQFLFYAKEAMSTGFLFSPHSQAKFTSQLVKD